jgi:preprotein translocase subunit YajC
VKQDGSVDSWCILRTSSGRTLRLAESLAADGIETWTPRRTIKRAAPGNRRRMVMGQRRVMIEVDLPIVPGFVFARADMLDDIIRASALPFGPHPSFSLLHIGERVPLVGEGQVAGLREAEREAYDAIMSEREAETREQERIDRALRLNTEAQQRKALRKETKNFAQGDAVTVDDMVALSGIVGTVVEGRGTSAVIHFGGSLTMEVEAWRVRTVSVGCLDTRNRDAA